MKTVLLFLLSTMICLASFAPTVFAAGDVADNGSSLLLALFVGFFALIVVFQLVPACLMFVGMVRGLGGNKSSQKNSSSNVRDSHV